MIDNVQIVFVVMTNRMAYGNPHHHYHHHKVQVYMAKFEDGISRKLPNYNVNILAIFITTKQYIRLEKHVVEVFRLSKFLH